jgi:hypothetical protein
MCFHLPPSFPMSAKRPPSSVSLGSKKTCFQHAFSCPTPGCNKSSKSIIGLRIHFSKSPKCTWFQTSKSHKKVTPVIPTALPVALQDPIDYPWDDEDSLDELGEDAVGNDVASTNGFKAPPAHPAGIYSESMNNSALRFGIHFTTEQYRKTKLLKILSDAKASHYLYKEVMDWGSAAHLDNYNFNPTRSCRNAQVKYLENRLQCQHSRPHQIPTRLPAPLQQVVQTTTFNFTNQLFMLVSDQALFGNLDNLDVNVDNPFGKHVPPNRLLSTVNSGHWYNSAYCHKVKNPSKDFMMPIIFACDETHLRKGGKAASWPLLFNTSILNQKSRNLPTIAWPTLGYINDLSLIQSSAKDRYLSKELKAERCHENNFQNPTGINH